MMKMAEIIFISASAALPFPYMKTIRGVMRHKQIVCFPSQNVRESKIRKLGIAMGIEIRRKAHKTYCSSSFSNITFASSCPFGSEIRVVAFSFSSIEEHLQYEAEHEVVLHVSRSRLEQARQ